MCINDYRKDTTDDGSESLPSMEFHDPKDIQVLQCGWGRNGGCGYAEKKDIEVLECLIG